MRSSHATFAPIAAAFPVSMPSYVARNASSCVMSSPDS